MASLLERMNIQPNDSGPVRSKSTTTQRASSAPYNRADRPKGDVNSTWSHDLFEYNNNTPVPLSERLTAAPSTGPPRPNITPTIAIRALRDATTTPTPTTPTTTTTTTTTDTQLVIKGASTSHALAAQGNVVEVTGLVRGTTPDDVCTIFKRCGPIATAKSVPGHADSVAVRITFKSPASAAAAVQKFHGQPADGKTLGVKIVGTLTTTLGGRLGGVDGLGIVRQEGSVDVLMDPSSEDTGSKMRSDSYIADPRAHVLVAPPGADPADYLPESSPRQNTSNRRGRGNGRRGRRGGGGGAGRMDID